ATTALNATAAATTLAVNSGTLTLGQPTAPPALPVVTLAGTAAMNLAGSEILTSLAGAAGTTLALAGNGTLTTGAASNTTMAGRITGTGSLVKQGTGSFTLGAGSNDYSGSTTVNAGTLATDGDERLPNGTALTVATGATALLGGNETAASLLLRGTLDGVGRTLTAASTTLESGTVLANLGAGSLSSSGTSALNGTAASGTVNVTGGSLTLGSAGRFTASPAVDVATGAILRLQGDNTAGSLVLAGRVEGTGTLTAATYDLNAGTAVANLGGGELRSTGTSRIEGTSAASRVDVNSGQLTLASPDRLLDTAALNVANGARLTLTGNDLVGNATLNGTLDGTGTLTATTTTLNGATVLANLGAGTLTSSGNSRLEGTAGSESLTISTGTLTAASAGRFTAAPATSIAGGASLAMAGDQTLGGLTGSGSVALGTFTLTAGGAGDSSFAGDIQGAGGLSKAGAGTQTLTGDVTYTGLTRVLAGTLRVGDGGTSGRIVSTSGFELAGTLAYARSDTVTLAQSVSGNGGLTQAGTGTLQVSGNNKTYTGPTQVQSGRLATTGTQELPDLSQVRVANGATLALGGAETLGGIDADGSVALSGSLTAGGDLLMRGAVTVANNAAISLDATRIDAPNAANDWGSGALSIAARGALALASGQNAGADRNLTLGTVRVAQGGSISGGALTLAQGMTVEGGVLTLTASAARTELTTDTDLNTFLATRRTPNNLPIGIAADVVTQQAGSAITVAAGGALKVVSTNSGSVALTNDNNSFEGWLSVISGGTAADPRLTWTVAQAGATRDVQSRIRVSGTKVTVGTDLPLVNNFPGRPGLIADTILIRAEQLSTTPGGGGSAQGLIFARLPFDNAAGSDGAIPGLTLDLRQPVAFATPGSFGTNNARILVSVGDSGFPLRAGLASVQPRPVVPGTTTVQLAGPDFTGGYSLFIEAAGRPNTVPVFYNGLSPSSPQVNNTLGATVAVSEGARRERFEESVRTENVATRLRSGVIAEVGPGSSATSGVGGASPPQTCRPAAGSLGCEGGTK
ncbi:MAG: autotransporter-associated beta strand repeat-containing protein, partial [Rubrivivax sp.]|nr:autotransporter-associated beta strand repeat-containing protein [Rubrivivax sp.]